MKDERPPAPDASPEPLPEVPALPVTPAPDTPPLAQYLVMPAPKKAVPAPNLSPEIPLSLDEFCRRLSLQDRRATLIGGFHLVMRRAGRLKDTDAAYRAAFSQFIKE